VPKPEPKREVEKKTLNEDVLMISDIEEALNDLVEAKSTPEEEIRRLPKSRKVRKLESDEDIKDETEVEPPKEMPRDF
jgi:hypothetical protein